MRYLSVAFFLTLILGVAGCGDTTSTSGEAGTGGAMEEMAMDEAPAAEDMMGEGSDDMPAWQVLQQNVVHSE